MLTEQDLEEGYREAQEFAAVGEDISHWQYLLANAVSARREDICDFLLSHGIDGSSELFWIAWPLENVQARLSLLRLFHRHGVRVSQEQSEDGDTSVHGAAQQGQLQILQFLVEEMGGRCAFNQLNDLDWTPLHGAVAEGHLECARYLLEQGHNPNAMAHVLRNDRLGWSILDKAVKTGNEDMIRLLLEWKADPDFPGWMWTTARDRAEGKPCEYLLAIPRLAKPRFTPHRKEIERQLVQDFPVGTTIDWSGSKAAGPVMQLRGDPLQAADGLQLVDPSGKTLFRGRFRFVILTPEQDLRAFWMDQEGIIPDSLWNSLPRERRCDLIMDSRNQDFRENLQSRPR